MMLLSKTKRFCDSDFFFNRDSANWLVFIDRSIKVRCLEFMLRKFIIFAAIIQNRNICMFQLN